MNVRLEKSILEKIDILVRMGFFKTRTEAIKKALLMLINRYYGEILKQRLEKIREGTENYPSLTKIVEKIHEEEE